VGTIQAVKVHLAANRLRIMAMEELEEMKPGFATRFDGEWELTFDKIFFPEKLGKKVGPRLDSNSNPCEYEREIGPDPPRPGRHEPSSTIFQSLARHDRPCFIHQRKYDSEYDEEALPSESGGAGRQARSVAPGSRADRPSSRTGTRRAQQVRPGRPSAHETS
jgi:hypothetical protein